MDEFESYLIRELREEVDKLKIYVDRLERAVSFYREEIQKERVSEFIKLRKVSALYGNDQINF